MVDVAGSDQDCECGKDCTTIEWDVVTIDARRKGVPIHYRELNCAIRKMVAQGWRKIVLKNVTGQRYIAATFSQQDLYISIHGTPGNDLGAFLSGPTIEVFGNAQDMTANTMNDGRIVVHGNAWDVTGLASRGGKILIRGNSGYRVGIHMKEFGSTRPTMVIGGTVKDYLGEYMAGGTILVLGLGLSEGSPVGVSIGAGIHGGRIFVRGKVGQDQLGPGALMTDLDAEDRAEISQILEEFESYFHTGIRPDWTEFVKIVPASSRPYGGKYDKTNI